MNAGLKAALAGIGFVGAIVGANALTSNFGMIPAGFGLTTTAGTPAAGATFVLRDLVHEHKGRLWSAGLIGFAAVVTAFVAPSLALASAATFLAAELLDLGVYEKLRKRGYMKAVVGSSLVGALLDSWLFLVLAGFPVTWAAVAGQFLVKAAAVGVGAGLMGLVRRALSRKRK